MFKINFNNSIPNEQFVNKFHLHSFFYKNHVFWSQGLVVLKFSFVLNNGPLFFPLFSTQFQGLCSYKKQSVTKRIPLYFFDEDLYLDNTFIISLAFLKLQRWVSQGFLVWFQQADEQKSCLFFVCVTRTPKNNFCTSASDFRRFAGFLHYLLSLSQK